MAEMTSSVPVLSTRQELEQAIQKYKASDLSGSELLRQWQAIREASLNLDFSEPANDGVPAEHSY